MTSLTLKRDYLEMLLTKIRGIMGGEGVVVPDPGSNPTDDDAGVALESRPEDLSYDEVKKEIDGLNDRQKAELIALLWIGRGDLPAEEWESAVERAMTEITEPVPDYLLRHPLVAEHVAEGLDRV